MLSWEKKVSIISHMETKSIHTYIRNRYKLIERTDCWLPEAYGGGWVKCANYFSLNKLNKTNKTYS